MVTNTAIRICSCLKSAVINILNDESLFIYLLQNFCQHIYIYKIHIGEELYKHFFLLSFQSFCFDNVYMYVLLLCKKCEIKYV